MAVEEDEGLVGCFDEAEVGIDFSLSVEPEGVDGLVWFEGVDFVGEHVVEEGVAVWACDFEGGFVGLVEEDGGFSECGVFHVEIAEGFDDGGLVVWLGGAVVEEEGVGGLVVGLEGGWCGHMMDRRVGDATLAGDLE